MLSMAGEVADGIQGHPLNTPIYLRDTVAPNLEAGASTAGRSPADLEVIVPTFAAPGSTSDEVQEWRELARMQVAFYGSTPNYAFIFDQLDREDRTEEHTSELQSQMRNSYAALCLKKTTSRT